MRRRPLALLLLGSLVALGACSKASSGGIAPDPTAHASGSAKRPRLAGLALPLSPAHGVVPSGGFALYVRTTGVSLADEGAPILRGPADPKGGYEAKDKRGGNRRDLLLTTLRDAIPKAQEGVARPEAVLYVDRATTSRCLLEILFTLAQDGFSRFDVVVRRPDDGEAFVQFQAPKPRPPRPSPAALGSLEVQLLGALGGAPPSTPSGLSAAPSASAPTLHAPLEPVLLIGEDGVRLRAGGVAIGPGCTPGGAGKIAESAAMGVDLAPMGACLHQLLHSREEFASEGAIVLTPAPGVDVETLVRVGDAVRYDFPDQLVGVSP